MKNLVLRPLRVTAVAAPLVGAALMVAPVLAATTGALSVTDRTDDPVNYGSGSHVPADETMADGQSFWDGSTLHVDADTSGHVYRTLTGTPAVPTGPCADGQVSLTAEATFENLGPGSGDGYSGGLFLANEAGELIGSGSGPLTNAAVGTHAVSTTVSAPVDALDDIVVIAAVETHHWSAKAWDLSGFNLDYSWACPAVAQDDFPVVDGDATTTFNPLSNDVAESSPTDEPADLDPTTVELYDPVSETWVTTLTTDDGTYTVDPENGEITFDPVDGFSGEATVPVSYRVANTDGAHGEGVITVNGVPVVGVSMINPLLGIGTLLVAVAGAGTVYVRRRVA